MLSPSSTHFITAGAIRACRSLRIGMQIIGLAVVLSAQDASTGESDVTRRNTRGVRAHTRGRYAEAVGLLRQALTSAEAKLASGHPVVATTLSNLAKSEIALGSLAEAETHLKPGSRHHPAQLWPSRPANREAAIDPRRSVHSQGATCRSGAPVPAGADRSGGPPRGPRG